MNEEFKNENSELLLKNIESHKNIINQEINIEYKEKINKDDNDIYFEDASEPESGCMNKEEQNLQDTWKLCREKIINKNNCDQTCSKENIKNNDECLDAALIKDKLYNKEKHL